MLRSLVELDKKHNAKLVAQFNQSTNHNVALGKCYGLSIEQGIRQLNFNEKTAYDLKKPFPKMRCDLNNIHTSTINSFAPITQRVNVYHYSQLPFYTMFTNGDENHMLNSIKLERSDKFYMFSNQMDNYLNSILKTPDNATCIITVFGFICGHAMQYKKHQNYIEFFDCNTGEYHFESEQDFKEWLPKYIQLKYSGLFYAGTTEMLTLKPANQNIPLSDKLKYALNTATLLYHWVTTRLFNINLSYFFKKNPETDSYINTEKKDHSLDDNLSTAKTLDKLDWYKAKMGKEEINCNHGLRMHEKNIKRKTGIIKDDMSTDKSLDEKLTKQDDMRQTKSRSMGICTADLIATKKRKM